MTLAGNTKEVRAQGWRAPPAANERRSDGFAKLSQREVSPALSGAREVGALLDSGGDECRMPDASRLVVPNRPTSSNAESFAGTRQFHESGTNQPCGPDALWVVYHSSPCRFTQRSCQARLGPSPLHLERCAMNSRCSPPSGFSRLNFRTSRRGGRTWWSSRSPRRTFQIRNSRTPNGCFRQRNWSAPASCGARMWRGRQKSNRGAVPQT